MAYDGKSLKSGNSLEWDSASVMGGLWALFGSLLFIVLAEGLNAIGAFPGLIGNLLLFLYPPCLLVGSIIIHRSWRVTLMMVLTAFPIMLFFFCLIGMVQGFGLPV